MWFNRVNLTCANPHILRRSYYNKVNLFHYSVGTILLIFRRCIFLWKLYFKKKTRNFTTWLINVFFLFCYVIVLAAYIVASFAACFIVFRSLLYSLLFIEAYFNCLLKSIQFCMKINIFPTIIHYMQFIHIQHRTITLGNKKPEHPAWSRSISFTCTESTRVQLSTATKCGEKHYCALIIKKRLFYCISILFDIFLIWMFMLFLLLLVNNLFRLSWLFRTWLSLTIYFRKFL